MKHPRALLITILTVGVITLWLHWPAVRAPFLHWDDQLYMDDVVRLKEISWSSIRWAFTTTGHDYYSPLTWLSYLVDYQAAGLNPQRFHATSVVIHALNTGVVCLLTWLLAGSAGAGPATRWAMAAGVGLVFGIHPFQVESVAWVAERKNILSAHFALWGLCAYTHGARSARPQLWRNIALSLFALALLAKPQVITLPLVMLALDLYPLRRWPAAGWHRLISEKAGFWLLSLACAALTVHAVFQVEGTAPLTLADIQQRCLVAVRGVIFYLWKLAWPSWLSPFYPLEGEVSLRVTEFAVTGTLFLFLCALAVWSVRRWPVWTSAWVAFLALLLPVIGLVQTGNQATADRYMYLAMLPLLWAVATVVNWSWQRASSGLRAVMVPGLGCWMLFLGFLSQAQIPIWRSEEALWRAAWRQFPDSGYINNELASALRREGRLNEALAYAQRAAKISPGVASVHHQLGVIHLLMGDYAQAVRDSETAVRCDPTFKFAWYNLACAYTRSGQLSKALEILERIVPGDDYLAHGAAQDRELDALRADPILGPRLTALLNR